MRQKITSLFLTFFFFAFTPKVFASTICQDNFYEIRTCPYEKIPDANIWQEKSFAYQANITPDTSSGKYFLLIKEPLTSNFIFSFHVRGESGEHKKAVIGFTDEQNYLELDLKSSPENNDSWIIFSQIKNGQKEILAKKTYINQAGNWYYVEIRVGTSIIISVFDNPLISLTDLTNIETSGYVGFVAENDDNTGAIVNYDHFLLEDINTRHPVILIPGLGASWNPTAIFSCDLLATGDWTMAPYADVYTRLIKTFTDNGYTLNQDLFIYTYDWRKSLIDQGKDLQNFIQKKLQNNPYQNFNIVSHSLGGLVIRSYLSQNPANHHLKKVVTLGSPHQGTVLAYPIWEGGEIWTDDPFIKVATSFLVNHCQTPLKLTSKDVIQNLSPSFKDLLPVFNFLKTNDLFLDVFSLKEQNVFLKENPLPDNFYHTQFITVSGNGQATLDYLEVEEASVLEKALGLWPDGKPKVKHYTDTGDGTILKDSSLTSQTFAIIENTGHSGLVTEDNALKTVFKYLNQPEVNLAPKETSFTPPNISEIKLPLKNWENFIWKRYQLKIR